MLTPELIEDLQRHGLLEMLEYLGADFLLLLRIGGPQGLQHARAQPLLVEFLVLVEPHADRQLEVEVLLQAFLQAFDVPKLLRRLRRHEGIDDRIDDVAAHVLDQVGDPVRAHQVVAQFVDGLALIVCDVVVFEQVLADIEVVRFDLALRVLDRPRHQPVLDGLAFLHAQALQHRAHARRREDAHQRVFQRQVETGRARITLASGTAT